MFSLIEDLFLFKELFQNANGLGEIFRAAVLGKAISA